MDAVVTTLAAQDTCQEDALFKFKIDFNPDFSAQEIPYSTLYQKLLKFVNDLSGWVDTSFKCLQNRHDLIKTQLVNDGSISVRVAKVKLQVTFFLTKLTRLMNDMKIWKDRNTRGELSDKNVFEDLSQSRTSDCNNLTKSASALLKQLADISTGNQGWVKRMAEVRKREDDLLIHEKRLTNHYGNKREELQNHIQDMIGLNIGEIHSKLLDLNKRQLATSKDPFSIFRSKQDGANDQPNDGKEIDKFIQDVKQASFVLVNVKNDIENMEMVVIKTTGNDKIGENLEAPVKLSAAITRSLISKPLGINLFEIKPPPNLAPSCMSSIEAAQEAVGIKFATFRWPLQTAPLTSGCSTTKETPLTPWQRFMYHYFNPWQDSVPGMLVAASAGAGKSWVVAELCSTWGREGHGVFIATKNEALISDIQKAMFKCRADFNIQNLIVGNGTELIEDASFAGSPNEASELAKQGFIALEQMGVHIVKCHTQPVGAHFHPKIWTLNKLETLETKEGFRNFKNVESDPEFPMSGTLIELDEAHLLVSPTADLSKKQMGNYQPLIEQLFRHRKNRPVALWPRVVLYTATPVATSPCDVVRLLNLLVDEESAWLDFTWRQGSDNIPEVDDDKITSNFLKLYVNDDGSLNEDGQDRWEKLAAGKISYISMYGDRSHFAQAEVTVESVTLSPEQTKSALCCLGYDLVVGSLKCAKAGQPKGGGTLKPKAVKASKTTSKSKTVGKKGAKEPTKTEVPVLSTPDTALEPAQENFREKMNCAVRQVLNPKVTPNDSMSTAAFANRYYPNVSRLVDYMIKGINEDYNQYNSMYAASLLSRSNYASASPTLNAKIFLFVVSSEKSSYKSLLKLLIDHKYKSVTFKEGKIVNAEGGELYKRFIDFSNLESDEQTIAKDFYNSEENNDGRQALIFICASANREGISLNNVRKVFILGAETTQANLTQAIARAFRFCSSTFLPYDKLKGWTISVYLQQLEWNDAVQENPKILAKLEKTFGAMLRAANPHGAKLYKSIDFMMRLISDSGVDKQLFGALNSSSTVVPLPL